MNAEILIRAARTKDARPAIETLRRSIEELCEDDHRGDPVALASWLANKTVHSWAKWASDDRLSLLVAERDGRIAGVGAVAHTGAIMLTYTHPEARFSGVSSTLLREMETIAAAHGAERCVLRSTRTARRFYERRGYAPASDDPHRLEKPLTTTGRPG